MPSFDAPSAECHVFVYREGLLSPVGHDLKLAVTRLTIEVTPEPLSIEARFDPTSLRVVCAVRGGADDPAALSESDRHRIERAIADDVLEARRHPDIRFHAERITAEGDGFAIAGDLTLHGRTRPLLLHSRAQGADQIAEVLVHQPAFGIRPYTALLGALKVRPDVRVRLRLPTSWRAAA